MLGSSLAVILLMWYWYHLVGYTSLLPAVSTDILIPSYTRKNILSSENKKKATLVLLCGTIATQNIKTEKKKK